MRGGDLPAAFRLPEALREELARPFGPVLQTDRLQEALAGDAPVVAVGDVVSMTLKALGLTPKLFVCDYRTLRGHDDRYEAALGTWGDREARVRNPPATVTREAWLAVREAFAKEGTTRIVVDGEEDLVAIPVFLECPAGTRVLYGAPGQGVVVVTADEEFKREVGDLLGRMERVDAPAP